MKKLSLFTEAKRGPLALAHALYVPPDLSLVGETTIARVFIWEKVGPLPRVTLPSKRVVDSPSLVEQSKTRS